MQYTSLWCKVDLMNHLVRLERYWIRVSLTVAFLVLVSGAIINGPVSGEERELSRHYKTIEKLDKKITFLESKERMFFRMYGPSDRWSATREQEYYRLEFSKRALDTHYDQLVASYNIARVEGF